MNDVLINKQKVLEHLQQLNNLLFCYDVSLLDITDEKQLDEFDEVLNVMDKILNNYK